MTRLALFPLLLALLGCTPLPELDAARSAEAVAAPYPELIPAERILAAADTEPRITAQSDAALTARAADLRARAARQPALPSVDLAADELRARAARLRAIEAEDS